MKGRPMVPGGRGLVQLGSSPLITKTCHSFTAAKSNSTGSTTVHSKVTNKVYRPMTRTLKKEEEKNQQWMQRSSLGSDSLSLLHAPFYTHSLLSQPPRYLGSDKLVHTKFIFNCSVISPRPRTQKSRSDNSQPFVMKAHFNTTSRRSRTIPRI